MRSEKRIEMLPPEDCHRQARGFVGGVEAVESFVGRELERDAYHGELDIAERGQAHLDGWIFFYLDDLLGVETEEGERLMKDPALRERLKRVFVDAQCDRAERSNGGDVEEMRAIMMGALH